MHGYNWKSGPLAIRAIFNHLYNHCEASRGSIDRAAISRRVLSVVTLDE